MTKHSPFRYFKTSPEIIRLAVMLYVRFPLSLRNVEDLLHERGIEISHETVRFWWNRFGPMFAAEIRRNRVSRMRSYSNWSLRLNLTTFQSSKSFNNCRDLLSDCEYFSNNNGLALLCAYMKPPMIFPLNSSEYLIPFGIFASPLLPNLPSKVSTNLGASQLCQSKVTYFWSEERI